MEAKKLKSNLIRHKNEDETIKTQITNKTNETPEKPAS